MAEQKIPKKIHFIWYGDKLPKFAQENLRRCEALYPDYEIKIWGEEDFDPETRRYTREALKAGKWAFVSDYLRVKILYEEGGIYLDTDMVAVKSIEPYLGDNKVVMGFEYRKMVTTGFTACEPKHPLFRKVLEVYEAFDHLEENEKFKFMVNNELWTYYMVELYGLILNNKTQQLPDGIKIMPYGWFSDYNIGAETYFLHDHQLSWTAKWKAKIMNYMLPKVRKYWMPIEPILVAVAAQMKVKNRNRIKAVMNAKAKKENK